MIQWVTEIKVRAERKAGELLASMDKNTGAMGVGSNQHEVRYHDVTAPKLADLGISKNDSSRWQKLAAMPDAQFEQAVVTAKERAGEVTTAAMLRAARPPRPVEPESPVANVPTPDPVNDQFKQDGEVDLLHDLEAADKEIRRLTAIVQSLESSDQGREIVLLHDRVAGLEGRLRQESTSLAEAKKDARWAQELLRKIMKRLNVEKFSDILGALPE
jgi:hypothetical protein